MSLSDMKPIALAALVVGLATSPPLFAQDDPPNPMVISGGVQLDDDGTTDVLLGLDYAAGERTWLSFYGGYTDASDDQVDVQFRTALFAIDHRFGKVGVTGAVEFWGDPDELDSTDLRGQLYFQNGGFRAAVISERRNIDVTARGMDLQDRPFERVNRFNADAIGGSLRYSGERFTLYGSHLDYDYDFSRLVDSVVDLIILRFVSESALTLANSFVDDSTTAGLDIEFANNIFNLEYSTYTGAVDKLDTYSFSSAMLFPVADRVDLEVRVGVSDSENLDSSFFGGITFFVYR